MGSFNRSIQTRYLSRVKMSLPLNCPQVPLSHFRRPPAAFCDKELNIPDFNFSIENYRGCFIHSHSQEHKIEREHESERANLLGCIINGKFVVVYE